MRTSCGSQGWRPSSCSLFSSYVVCTIVFLLCCCFMTTVHGIPQLEHEPLSARQKTAIDQGRDWLLKTDSFRCPSPSENGFKPTLSERIRRVDGAPGRRSDNRISNKDFDGSAIEELAINRRMRLGDKLASVPLHVRRRVYETVARFALGNGTTTDDEPALKQIYKDFHVTGKATNTTCDLCKLGVLTLQDFTSKYAGKYLIEKIEPVCAVIWPWLPDIIHHDYCDVHIENECLDLCVGMLHGWSDVIADVLASILYNPQRLCEAAKACPHDNSTVYPVYPKVEVVSAGQPTHPDPRFMMHVSDIHLDQNYEVGAITNCKMPVCCHSKYGRGNPGAGEYGDFTCDSPMTLVKSLFSEVPRHPNVSHIIFTGDAPAHDLWMQTKETNLDAVLKVTAMGFDAAELATKQTGKPVRFWPTLGNHAYMPVNCAGGPLRDGWLLGPVGDLWGKYLPKSAIVSFKWGGYYTAPMDEGLHIISLQSNYYDTHNLYLDTLEHWDIAGQLTWLREVLQQIDALGEKAIIIAHEKPGSFKLGNWPLELTRLLSVYAHRIAGIYCGHNHNDMFHIIKATHPNPVAPVGEPVGLVLIPSSLTPVDHATQPSYRVYELNSPMYAVSDFVQYRADVDAANKVGYVEFNKAYTARQLYDVPIITPQTMALAAKRMGTNETMWNRFRTAYHGGLTDKDSVIDVSPAHASCFVSSSLASEFKECMAKSSVQMDKNDQEQAELSRRVEAMPNPYDTPCFRNRLVK